MKTTPLLRTFGLLLSCITLAMFTFGCATHEQHSFNADFNQSLPTAPNYYIEDGNDAKFYVTVSQGRMSSGQERITDVKRAASRVAEYEARRRGWKNWRVDYIYERDQGWMHVVKAEVVRQNAAEFQGSQPEEQH